MLEVKTNNEIREVKANVFFGLGIKQILILGPGIVLNLILYFNVWQQLPDVLGTLLTILFICPFIFLASPPKDGLTGYRYIRKWLYYYAMSEYIFFSGRSLWSQKKGDRK